MDLKDIDHDYLVEDTQYECKARLNREDVLGWMKSVAGFANSKGGIMFIGVEDKTYKLIGFDKGDLDKEKSFFYHEVREHLANIPAIISSVLSYEINGTERYILKFVIQESKIKPIILKYDNMPMIFMRRDGYTNPATIEEILKMPSSSKSPSFDTEVTDIKFGRNDFSDFFRFYAERNEGKVPTDKELGSIGFFDENGFLKRGAYLFSDKYSGQETKVVCSLYKGVTRGDDYILASNPFSGNLIRSYYFIWDFVQARMNHGFIKKDEARVNIDSYPSRALFEAVINALAHRDYYLSNTQTSIDLFTNRIVISSPGSLFNGGDIPPTYDLNSFISRRRNAVISDVFVFSKAMEAKGTGFEKIEYDYKDADTRHKPFIFSKNNQFSIVLPDLTCLEGVTIEENSISLVGEIKNPNRFDLSILAFCYSAKRTVREISSQVQVSNSSFLRDKLDDLVKQGFLLSSKEGKASAYSANLKKVHLK